MTRTVGDIPVILSAAAANGAGTGHNVQRWEDIVYSIATDGGGDAALTVKCQASIAIDEPDWDSAQSVTNMWVYADIIDGLNGSSIDGGTGIVASSADVYKIVAINFKGYRWANWIVSGRTAGEVTILGLGSY